jgi:hypothetical protein
MRTASRRSGFQVGIIEIDGETNRLFLAFSGLYDNDPSNIHN